MVNSYDFSSEDILDFSQDKFERKVNKFREKPIYITWEITNACNLHCKHCLLPDIGHPLDDELNTKEAFDVVDKIVDAGARNVLFSGGEPLLRSDILEIANYASQNITLSLQTNGYFLEESALELRNIGFKHIQVSIDGSSAKSHDFLRGKGSFEKAMNGIERCKELGFPLITIAAVVYKGNFNEIDEMINFGINQDIDFFELRAFAPLGNNELRSQLALSMEQRKELYKFIAAKQQKIKNVGSEDPYIYMLNKRILDTCLDISNQMTCIGCAAGIIGCTIKPNGKVFPCSSIPIEIGDLKNEKLSTIWKDSPILQQLRDRSGLKGKCGICEYKFICGGCRGSAVIHSDGDIMAEDPLCWYKPNLSN